MNNFYKLKVISGVICFGDSILAGIGASDRQFGCAKLVKASLCVPVSLRGRNRDTSLLGLKRIESNVLDQKNYSHVVVLFGNNDSWVDENGKPYISLEQFEVNMNKILDLIEDNGQVATVCNLQPLDIVRFTKVFPAVFKVTEKVGVDPVQWQKKYSDCIEAICHQRKNFFINIREPLNEDILTTISSDGIHPNDKGHRIIADCIISALSRIDSSLQFVSQSF